MPLYKLTSFMPTEKAKHTEGVIKIDQSKLSALVEKISKDKKGRDGKLALRILYHVIGMVDKEGKAEISAEKFSTDWGVCEDAVIRCLDYLQEIGALKAKT